MRFSGWTVAGAGALALAAAVLVRGIPGGGEEASAPGGPLVEVALPAGFSDAARRGSEVYRAQCAACHGENAAGREGAGPPLVHRIYEPSHHGDMAFLLAARNGVRAHHWRFGDMPPVAGIDEPEVAAVVAYVRELQAANGIR